MDDAVWAQNTVEAVELSLVENRIVPIT